MITLLWHLGFHEQTKLIKSPKEGELKAEGGGAYCPGVTS